MTTKKVFRVYNFDLNIKVTMIVMYMNLITNYQHKNYFILYNIRWKLYCLEFSFSSETNINESTVVTSVHYPSPVLKFKIFLFESFHCVWKGTEKTEIR